MTGCDCPPYHFPPQKKSQGPNPALPTKVPLPWCPSQPLLRRPSLHPDGFSGVVQPPWATPGLGILPPTHSFGLEGTWPPPPNLCQGSPVLSTSPLVFPIPLFWGLPWILSQGTRAVREGTGPSSLLEPGPGKVLIMGQAPNTATMGHHVPSPDGPGSKFTSSSPGPCS